MTLAQEMIAMIDQVKPIAVPVVTDSDLYLDIGLDSMTFVSLLMQIEEQYGILFALEEMEECAKVKRLIALVEKKVKEIDYAARTADESQ